MLNSYTYYGRKGCNYFDKSFRLYPANMQHSLVECCMGSGNQMANSLYGDSVKRVAIEKDKSIYLLNKAIQNNPFETIRTLENIVYSKEEYKRARQIVDEVNQGKDIPDEEVVKTAYGSLIMSYNSMRGGYRNVDDKRKKKIYTSIFEIVTGLNKAWRDLEIIHDDFMNYPEYWRGGQGTFVFADVPYEKKKRSVSSKRKNVGYVIDWTDEDQDKFIDFVLNAQDSESPSNMMICTNMPLDEEGNLRNLQSDKYCQRLLKVGFRLVVVEKRYASVANKNSKKKHVAEVVFINYDNILGRMNDFEYYDYSDVYGKEV